MTESSFIGVIALLRFRVLLAATAMFLAGVSMLSGYLWAESSYQGFWVDGRTVKVILGRVEAPNHLLRSMESEYVRNRHKTLSALRQADPTAPARALVVLKQYLSLDDTKALLAKHGLQVTEVWVGRPGFRGTGIIRVTGPDLDGAYADFVREFPEYAAEEVATRPETRPTDLAQQNAKAALGGGFQVFAFQVTGAAGVLEALTRELAARMVDVHYHPAAEQLARQKGLTVRYQAAPLRPDEESFR